MVESPLPLLVIISRFSEKAGLAGSSVPAYPLKEKSQSSKSLPGAYGSGFPTLMSAGRGFDTDCPIVLTASVSPVTAAFITVLDDYALCTMDDASCFLDIRLGPKTSVYEKHVSVKSTVASCDVTYCATTLQGFNK